MGITFSDSTHLNFNNEQVKQQLHVMQCRSPTFNDPAQCLLIPLQSPVGNGGVGAEAGAGAGARRPRNPAHVGAMENWHFSSGSTQRAAERGLHFHKCHRIKQSC